MKQKIFSLALCFFFCVACLVEAGPQEAYFSNHQHHIEKIFPKKMRLQLEDGSQWVLGAFANLSTEDTSIVDHWKIGDHIEFSIETARFRTWYYLINTDTGEKISTKMLKTAGDGLGPTIVNFNPEAKTVTLSDESKWKIKNETCLPCLRSMKKRFTGKVFVAREHQQNIFYLIASTINEIEYLEVVPNP